MIYVITGENRYQRDREVALIVDGCEVERLDGGQLEVTDLANIFMGQTLFATERVSIIDQASGNKSLWTELVPWLEKFDDKSTIVLIEPILDKRTKTFKVLQKTAKIIDCEPWRMNDRREAAAWVEHASAERGIKISHQQIDEIVQRAMRSSDYDDRQMIIDQQQLATVLDQLALVGSEVTSGVIDAVMAPDTQENVFELFDAALRGNTAKIHTMIANLRLHVEGHRVLALVLTQVDNLAALVLSAGRSAAEVASTIGVNPYALRPLAEHAHELTRQDVAKMIEVLARADVAAKHGEDPWLVLESALVKIASK